MVLCLMLFQLLNIFSLLELHVLPFARNLSGLGTAGLRFYIFTKIMLAGVLYFYENKCCFPDFRLVLIHNFEVCHYHSILGRGKIKWNNNK